MNSKGKFLEIINRNLARTATQKFFKKLYLVSLSGMNIGSATYSYETNGEFKILKRISDFYRNEVDLIIFDVGAHNGSYTKMLNQIFTKKNIYCFEPSDELFKSLKQNLSKTDSVNLYKIALGNENSIQKLYIGENLIPSMAVDFFNMSQQKIVSDEIVETVRLDSFCNEFKISRINLLKIDVEGFEYKVLEGAGNLIENSAIDFIQFEFGQHSVASRSFFYDFYNLLSPTYRIYRILSDDIYELSQYEYNLEVFVSATNYLAVSKKCSDKFQ